MRQGAARGGALFLCAMLGGTGCGASAPAHFYTLAATAPRAEDAAVACSVLVGRVSVPPAVDRPQFVVQIAENRVDIDEFNRWAAPLDDAIARTVAADLSAVLGTPDVAVAPLANFDPSFRVTIDVQRFDSVQGKYALLDAVWTVRAVKTERVQSGRTVSRQDVLGEDFAALAAAHSRALAVLSDDIGAAIRAAARQK